MKIEYFLMNYTKHIENTSSRKIITIISIITVIVLSPIFNTAEFLTFDDNWYIYENINVINFSFESIKNIFTNVKGGQYSPLGEFYNAILYSIFQKNATAFKICSLAVHLLNVILLFRVLTKIFGRKIFTIATTLIFAIHPMQVESVGWLSVTYTNAVFFMLAGYNFYLLFLKNTTKYIYLLPVITCYILGFLTKEQAILFPLGLFIIHLHKQNYQLKKIFLLEMLFWALIGGIFAFATIEVTKTGGPNIINRGVSTYEKIGLFSKTVLKYGYHFFSPHKLSFSYPYPKANSTEYLPSIIITTMLLLASIFFAFKNKLFRFGLIWSFGFLSLGLTFSFLHLRNQFMADRYAYFGIIGFSIALYSIFSQAEKKLKVKNNTLYLPIISLFIISFLFSSFKEFLCFKTQKTCGIML